ncbi:hypothetical protein [Nodosilinea sp. LEGE 07088]|nr:hypothetical protein [Nodosilinea sp. LEGE 07088]
MDNTPDTGLIQPLLTDAIALKEMCTVLRQMENAGICEGAIAQA